MPKSKSPRITEEDVTSEQELNTTDTVEQDTSTNIKNKQRKTITKRVGVKNLKAEYKRRQDITREQMATMPKVRIFIPKFGDKNGDVPLSININGYRMSLKTGMYHDLPKNVANLVIERYEQAEAAGKEFRISGDSNKEDALL